MGVTTVVLGNQCRWVLKIKQQTQSLPTAGAGEGSTELILIIVVNMPPEYKSRSLWGLGRDGKTSSIGAGKSLYGREKSMFKVMSVRPEN